MAARSSGIFPIEGFHPDKLMEVPVTTPAACPTTLENITTIRVVLVNATITGDADVTVTIGGQVVVFGANDLDLNGVALIVVGVGGVRLRVEIGRACGHGAIWVAHDGGLTDVALLHHVGINIRLPF